MSQIKRHAQWMRGFSTFLENRKKMEEGCPLEQGGHQSAPRPQDLSPTELREGRGAMSHKAENRKVQSGQNSKNAKKRKLM